MTITSFNIVVFFVSLSFLLAQLFVRDKHTSHIIFAIFCGSIAMTLAQKISGDAIGPYKYLIGLGALATCNGYWLLSRSLFRQKDAITRQHLGLALAISFLIFIKHSYLFVNSIELITVNEDSFMPHAIVELTTLLSSCVLVLSFWEGCRGYNNASKQEKAQRMLFLVTFGAAVAISKISFSMFAEYPLAKEWIVSSLIFWVLINTQILLYWRYRKQKSSNNVQDKISNVDAQLQDVSIESQATLTSSVDQEIAKNVQYLLVEQQLFLQPNLKVGDIAKLLNLPEYRISKVINIHFNANNFNQYVNEMRIDYAQQILLQPGKRHWSVLVVGLESGFASVGPFTRAFKAHTGYTPNQYRQSHLA